MSLSGEPGARIGLRDVDPAAFNVDATMDQHGRAARSEQRGETSWMPVIGGGLLVGYGLARGSLSGLLLAAAGGGLVYYGMTGNNPMVMNRAPDGESSIRVEKTVTINRPVDEIYDRWRNIERLPEIMSHLESVRTFGDGMSHWVARAPLGQSVEWDAEVLNDDEDRVISWRSTGDTRVPNVGAVHFHEAPSGRGTEVRVRIEYNPPAGVIGATFAKLFGEEPGQQVADDLRRFKSYAETGQVATVDGQSSGREGGSTMDAVLHKVRDVADAAGSATGDADSRP